MKVGRLDRPGHLVVDDAPEPIAGPGEIVVELAACGVCGTDLEKLRGHYQSAGKIGHEPVGRVSAIGEGVGNRSLGERVFVHHHVPCGVCAVCRRGDYTFCPTYSATNIDPGGFAEKFRVPRENVERGAVHPLDDRMTWETASLLEPAACALTALRRVAFQAGQTVAILGLGPVGLLYAGLARALGAAWIAGSEVSETRRSAGAALGIDVVVNPREDSAIENAVTKGTSGIGVDLAVVATGSPTVVATATRLTRRGGTVNLFGLPDAGSRLETDLQALYLRGTRVIPTYATTERDIEDVRQLLATGRLEYRNLVSHRYPLDRLADAFDMAGRPGEALKVIATGAAFAD